MKYVGQKLYCCCNIFSFKFGLYLVCFHCLLHGSFAILLIITSTYKPRHEFINYIVTGGFVCLIPVGILLFWTILYESWRSARFCAFVIICLTAYNVSTSLLYLITYFGFKANSVLDRNLFWTKQHQWVGDCVLPFTVWHVLAFILVFVTCFWWYYGYVVCRLSIMLKLHSDHPSLENLSGYPTKKSSDG